MTMQVLGVGLQTSVPLILEKLPGWCPVGEGTNVQSPFWAGPPEVTYSYKAPGTQAKSLVMCGVYRMKSQDIDGPCGGSLWWSLSCGRLWQGCSGPSHASGGEGPAGSCPSASLLEARKSREQLRSQRPGWGPWGQDPLGQCHGTLPHWEAKLPCPELANEKSLGNFTLGVCASC